MYRDTMQTQRVLEALSSVPPAERDRAFAEPWEAQAFAIAVAMHRGGCFTWDEWAATLGNEIERAQAKGDPDDGTTYYRHWLAAIERIVQEKGIATRQVLDRYRDAWDHAAERTPHGLPIELTPEDFA